MSRQHFWFAVVVVIVVITAGLLVRASDGKSANFPPAGTAARSCSVLSPGDDPLNFSMFAGRLQPWSGTVDVYLQVSSCTDMPVPDVTVNLDHCQFGQQTPFELAAKPRHLGRDESLKALGGGMRMEWYTFSAPPVTAKPLTLHLTFALPRGKGGPSVCIRGWGYTPHSLTITPTTDINWFVK
jgi:hypothetical protein